MQAHVSFGASTACNMEARKSADIHRCRAVSYLGPIYVRSNCLELPVKGTLEDQENTTRSECLDISKYKIKQLPANTVTEHLNIPISDTTSTQNLDINTSSEQACKDSGPDKINQNVGGTNDDTPDTVYRINGGIELIVHGKGEPPTCDVGQCSTGLQVSQLGQSTNSNIKLIDVDKDVDDVLEDLDNVIMSEQYNGHNDNKCSFKISSTEDNYVKNKYLSKQSLDFGTGLGEGLGDHSESPIAVEIERRASKSNENDSSKKALLSLTKHMSTIAKLKRRFFEGSPPKPRKSPTKSNQSLSKTETTYQSQTPSTAEIDKGSTTDSVLKDKESNKSIPDPEEQIPNTESCKTVPKPCKPGQYATESRAALMRASGRKHKSKHRRHSSEGILGRADLFDESNMRWSVSNLADVISKYLAVVAIDFGTTYSGYAYCFTHDPDTTHVMRRLESGDPGVYNQKIPTCILLTPEGAFHSFGYAARDCFHDLDPKVAVRWMYLDRFKMLLHQEGENLSTDTEIRAQNGKLVSALKVFAYSLAYFRRLVLQELVDQAGFQLSGETIRWVLTVPAIWKPAAKQFMRLAAYEAGIVPPDRPDQLLIALEPEAASIYCRRLRMLKCLTSCDVSNTSDMSRNSSASLPDLSADVSIASNDLEVGTRYMIVDCGGGTVDITVHELLAGRRLRELHRATGGAHGSIGVDEEFESLVCRLFGQDIVDQFRQRRPSGWVELMAMFESRKRTASPFRESPISVSIPYSFIDFYKKCRGHSTESAVRKFGDPEVSWTSNGQLRLSPAAMRRLFLPTISAMKQAIGDVLNHHNIKDLKYMFLVGGFAESSIVQHEMRTDFGSILKVIIPASVGMTILSGAVAFGIDPCVVSERCACLTYGVGVLHRFDSRIHPANKLIHKDGLNWCTDIFDVFVRVDQPVSLGEGIVRRYTPVRRDQTTTTINIYSTERSDITFITDDGVKKCGTLSLTCPDIPDGSRREIRTTMMFGDTEIRATATDVKSGHSVEAYIDFINS